MTGMTFDDDGATGGPCGGGVATGNGKGEGEVAGAEDSDRADGNEHTADVGARGGLAIRLGGVDDGFDICAFTQESGKGL